MKKVSYMQLMLTLLLLRIFYTMTFVPFQNDDTTNLYIGFTIATIVEALLVIPSLVLYKKFPDENVCTIAFKQHKYLGWIVGGIYLLLILFVIFRDLRFFDYFMFTAYPNLLSHFFVILLISLISFYAASKGVEGLFRTGTIVFVIFIISLAIMFLSIFEKLEFSNVLLQKPTLGKVNIEVMYEFSKSSELVLIPLLYPFVKEKLSHAAYGLIISKLILTYIIVSVCIMLLGSYLNISEFPFYEIGSYGETRVIERLNSFLLPAWIFISFMKIAVFLFSGGLVLSEFFQKKHNDNSEKNTKFLLVLLIPMALAIYFTSKNIFILDILDTYIAGLLVLLTGFIIPLLFCFKRRKK